MALSGPGPYGHQVKTQPSSHGQAGLEVRTLPAGLYHLRVGQGNGAYSQHIQVVQ